MCRRQLIYLRRAPRAKRSHWDPLTNLPRHPDPAGEDTSSELRPPGPRSSLARMSWSPVKSGMRLPDSGTSARKPEMRR